MTVRAPADLPDNNTESALAVLDVKPFMAELREAVAGVAAANSPLTVKRAYVPQTGAAISSSSPSSFKKSGRFMTSVAGQPQSCAKRLTSVPSLPADHK